MDCFDQRDMRGNEKIIIDNGGGNSKIRLRSVEYVKIVAMIVVFLLIKYSF